MYIKLLDNSNDIRQAFINRFVMSWDEFQIMQKDWIAEMEKNNYQINIDWYEHSFMWDRMDPVFSRVFMEDALAFLLEHSGPVLFLAEKGEDTYYQGERIVDFVAETDAHALAAKIKQEWYSSFGLSEQNADDTNALLPEDLYVFDSSLRWCVVFTHEASDLNAQFSNPIKAADSRICIISKDLM